METPDITFYGSILGGNIPLNVLECFKGFNETYKNYTLINHPYLKIRNENVIELLTINCTENEISNADTVCKEHIKLSLNLNRNMIVNSLQLIIKNAITVSKQRNEKNLNDKKLNNDTISNNIYNEFINKIMNDFKSIPMNRDANDLLIRMCILISLININSDMLNNIMFKLQTDMDLNTPFMVNKYIGTPSKYLSIIKDHLDNNTNIEVVSANIANDMLSSIEYILNHMISTTNKGNICKIYIASISIANAITKLGSSYNLNRTVEAFGIDIGSEKNITTNTKLFKLNETQKKIDQSKVLEGLKKLISNSITEAFSKNTSELAQSLSIINNISVKGLKTDTLIFKNIKQKNVVKIKGDMNTVQNITNKINNDIKNKIKENIDMITKDHSDKIDKSVIDMKKGTNISDITKDLANILSASIGSTTNITTNEDITDIVRNTFNLDQSFKYKKNENNVVDFKNKFNNEQLNKCSTDKDVSNVMSIIDTEARALTAEDIEQSNVIDAITKCTFNQNVLNDISNKILNEFDNIIKQSIESARKEVDESKRSETIGDIYAAGTALQQTLEGAGTVIEKTGGLIQSLGLSIFVPLVIGGIILLMGVIYIASKIFSGPSIPIDNVEAPDVEAPDVEAPDVDADVDADVKFKYLFNLNM